MNEREFLRGQVEEWMTWGDLTEDLDIDQAVDVIMLAYERSSSRVGVKLPLPDWCESFYKVMMENDQQTRFRYLRGDRAKASRH